MERLGIGIIGCGNISEAYLKAASYFPILDIKGIADIRHEAAEARAAQFGLRAMSVDELLADPSIEIIVNLTIPAAHVEVGLKALAAGKHVHSEKPLGLTTAEARPLLQMAKERGLRVGCAPDTFLGGSHQTCRKLIDEGAIGRPLAGSAFFMCPGHERWHPNPAFYYAKGGGPMLDMGPYYITALVNLIGPVARVAGITSRARSEREITSEPLKGTMIPVEVATHVAGTLEFVSGAVVSIAMSFDVPRHRHRPIELYGTDGSLSVPDPEPLLRRDRARHRGQGLDGTADRASLRERQLPDHRRRRHGPCHPIRTPASRVGRARVPCPRGHGGIPGVVGSGSPRHHRIAARAAGDAADDASVRLAGLDTKGKAGGQTMREALIVWGGWSGHEPEQCASIIAGMLEEEGFKVYVENSTEAFADPGLSDMSLIVPIYTMSKIEKEELSNLTAAVRGGVGLAGYHGGMCDAFREAVEYQFMCGGQWVAHPGNIIDYRVNITRPDDPIMQGIRDFDYRSEQYYMHVDPSNEVLATTTFSGEHAPLDRRRGHAGRVEAPPRRRAGLLQLPRACGERVRRAGDAHHPQARHALGCALNIRPMGGMIRAGAETQLSGRLLAARHHDQGNSAADRRH